MFTKVRQLRISLAAKCQILFGAAVVLIIGAALSVPWHRMEQLTEQLNLRAASALADNARAEHVVMETAGIPGYSKPADRSQNASGHSPSAEPATRATSAASESEDAIYLDATTGVAGSAGARMPRLLSLAPHAGNSSAAKFDRHAIAHFARSPKSLYYFSYYNRPDGTRGYRYAQPLYLDSISCRGCHVTAAQPQPRSADAPPSTQPILAASQAAEASPDGAPATQPILGRRLVVLPIDPDSKNVGWVGIVSVEFGSRIDTTQLLLNRAFILMAGLLAGILAFFTFYFITTRLILQPVRVLQETAEKVSQGDLNIRSDISTGDEFQQLSETFNTMLANLEQNEEALRAVNKSLDLRLGQLAETNVGLYESNRLKSEFLANVSHELRTPLNSILGFADLLKDAMTPEMRESKAARYINNIRQSGRNLLELINDLLDLAKIEAGRMEIRSEPLSLSDLFEGLVTILKPLAEQKQVSIEPMVSADVPILNSDPGKLQQVLYNLLSNAIKFSPESGNIGLSAVLTEGPGDGANGHSVSRESRDPGVRLSPALAEAPAPTGWVRICVTDNGPGVEPSKHNVIFEKFRQLDGSVTRTHSGTGLGLSISKELTALLGGSIGVESEPGKGARFWIELPLTLRGGNVDVRSRMAMS